MTKLLLAALIAGLPVAAFAQAAKKHATATTTTTTTVETETTTTAVVEPTPTPAPQPTLGEKAKNAAAKTKDLVQSTISNGGDRREASKISLLGEYSTFDLLLPGKLGGSIGWVQDRSTSIEAEYLSASYSVPAFIEDIGSFTDKRISIVRRVYGDRNSLNFHYGLSYFDTNINVGSKYLATATNTNAYAELMKQRSIGFIIGVGNRWTFPKGFTVGVDWISYAQPVFVVDQDSSIINSIKDENAKKTVQDVFQAALYFPRISVFKVALGWTF